MAGKGVVNSQTATPSVPHPGDFPLGSPQSRAAARAQLDEARIALYDRASAARAEGESRFSEFLSSLSDSDYAAFKAELKKRQLQYFDGDQAKLEEYKQSIVLGIIR
jgi:hypothetical protein